jgi:MurNAc alpha-1-phosphate uridylyltransferase
MIFAAGFGTRMGALTAAQPKPLIKVAGKALIDHALEVATGAGAGRVVVNTHYRGAQIEAHLAGGGVLFSRETDLILETGGGLRAALPLLGTGPVMTLNSDVVWTGPNPLTTLAAAWDGDRMDALVLVMPTEAATGHGPVSDFLLSPDGRIARARGSRGHVYVGAGMINPDCLADVAEPVFSLNLIWDRAIAAGRAFAAVHQGGWCDVGTPDGIALAEAVLRGEAHV